MSNPNTIDLSFPSTEHQTNVDNIAKILLISETGAGKSTFINYLYNYFHKGDLNNLKIAIPSKYHPIPTEQFSHNELNISDNTQSKTNICTQYMFTDPITYKQYLFLDTPGLSDTRGIEQNEININKIIEAITQLDNLTTIIIVVNGSISRLTINLRSVIACLNGNIPDIILENVIIILTNVKKHESSFDLKVLNLHGKVYPFYMQNNAFVSDPQTWTKSIRYELQSDWNSSMNQIKLILETINSFKQISLDAFIQMKQIRNEIKSIIHQARLEIIQIQKIQNELLQLDSAFQQADRDIITYQEKMLTISETKEILEKTLKEKINEIKIKSMKLCRICSAFNLAEELKYLIKQFQIESNLLENLETKLHSEELIKILTKLTRSIEENQEKIRRKRPSMQIISQDLSIEKKSTDINHLKTIDLVELHQNTTDHTLIKSILEELHRRAQGKSTDPLLTSNEILIINKYSGKYNQKSLHDLSYFYCKLQKRINDIIGSNILKLVDVNSELLIENCVVQTLLNEKEKEENNHQDTLFYPTTPRSSSQSMNNSFLQTPYPILLGFSHIGSAPYPSLNQPSPLPALPSDYSPNKHQSQTLFRLENYRYDLMDTKSRTSANDHQDFIPMPTPHLQRSTNVGFSLNNTAEHQHMTPSKPDLISFHTDLYDPSKSRRNSENEDFRSLNTSDLLSMYTDENLQTNEFRRRTIYQELERRCYGEYPMLIKEKKSLFQEKIKMHEMETIRELLIAQTTCKQKIRKYLKNDDVTLINNIPVELIIEANVLNQLILSKGKV